MRVNKPFFVPFVFTLLSFGLTSSFGQSVSPEAKRYFDRGMAAVELADLEAAIKEFEQAVRLAPDWPDAIYNLGLVQEKAEKYGDAAKTFRQYLGLVPNADDAEDVRSRINKLEFKAEQVLLADINSRDLYGRTPLHNASTQGKKEVAELLITKGANINAKDNGGNTPLHLAAGFGQKGVAELLVANGADVRAKNSEGNMPLYAAAFFGQKDVAEFLIAKGADINAKNKDGITPLQIALSNHHYDVPDLLRRHGAK